MVVKPIIRSTQDSAFLCPSKATNVFFARVIKAGGKNHAWYSGFPKEGVGLERRNVDVAENVSQNLKAYNRETIILLIL